MLAVLGGSPQPRSRGIFDPTSGLFVDSVTRKPVGEINNEEYLKRLRMVHCQQFGTKPKSKKSINLNNGSQVTEVNTTPPSSSDNFTTKWGSYMPYSSNTDVALQAEQRKEKQRKAPLQAEQKKEASEAERTKDASEAEQKTEVSEAEQTVSEAERKTEVSEAERKKEASEAEQRKDASEAERKEITTRNKRWYNFIFKKEYIYEPIWYKYRKAKSLWDGILTRTPDQSTSRTLLTSSTPSSTSRVMSESLPAMTSQSREDCMEGVKFQDYPDRVQKDKKKYIWQSLLCCCRQ